MRRVFISVIMVTLIGLFSGPAKASADGSCYPGWHLSNAYQTCANIAAISPGNDTRANLLLLSRDVGASEKASYPELGWDKSYGRSFFNWSLLRIAYAPRPENAGSGNYYGTRCQSFDSGTKAFNTAVKAARKVSRSDRKELTKLREFISDVCKGRGYRGQAPKDLIEIVTNAEGMLDQVSLGSKQAQDFVTYLNATNDFYGGNYTEAQSHYAALSGSKNKWVKETSAYMTGRTHINAALQNAFDKWGFFGGIAKASASSSDAAEVAFKDYLTKYPKGIYAASARGLIRRAHWLSGDLSALSREYQQLLNEADSAGAKADVIEEIDIKLMFEEEAAAQISDPELLTAINLMRMRKGRFGGDEKPVSLAEIEKQRAAFRGRDDLYSFLLANHAFYVAGDARKVLQLIPDAARQDNFTHLQFSRQALRGTALAVLNDRNEGGFWRDMLGGSKALYQRPMVELGLATFYERRGELDKVFAAGSPIKTNGIREILLQQVAGPDILNQALSDGTRPRHERDVALFTLLYKQLSRGDYAGFLKSQQKIPAGANREGGLYSFFMQPEVPVGLFGPGALKDEYNCPALRSTVTTLANAASNIDARLCLGDFWLANGFDYFRAETPARIYSGDKTPMTVGLGSSKSQFPGNAMPRHAIYEQIIAHPRATSDQRAYALYRAINCYKSSGSNGCGGKGVPQSQRKTWFQTLKRQYPSSKWAKKLKYFW